MARHSSVNKTEKNSLRRSETKKSKVGTRDLCMNSLSNIGQQGVRNESTRSKEVNNSEKLVKLAEQLIKSHPELSLEKALQIESQRQEAKRKRQEEATFAIWNNLTLDDDLENYLNNSEEGENWDVHDIDDCVEEIKELEISDEKENWDDDSGKKQRTLKIRSVNASNQKQ